MVDTEFWPTIADYDTDDCTIERCPCLKCFYVLHHPSGFIVASSNSYLELVEWFKKADQLVA